MELDEYPIAAMPGSQIVNAAHAEGFARVVSRDYLSAVGLTPSVYLCSAAAGASLEKA